MWQSTSTVKRILNCMGKGERGLKAPISEAVHALAAPTQWQWWGYGVVGPPPGGGATEGPQSRAAGRRRPQAAARSRRVASSRAGTCLTFGPGNTPAQSPESSVRRCWDVCSSGPAQSLLSLGITQIQPAPRVHRSAGARPHSHPRRSRKASAPRLRTPRADATVRLRGAPRLRRPGQVPARTLMRAQPRQFIVRSRSLAERWSVGQIRC